jgi:hypothetical protein
VIKGLAVVAEEANAQGKLDNSIGLFVSQSMKPSPNVMPSRPRSASAAIWTVSTGMAPKRNSKRKPQPWAFCPKPMKTFAPCVSC